MSHWTTLMCTGPPGEVPGSAFRCAAAQAGSWFTALRGGTPWMQYSSCRAEAVGIAVRALGTRTFRPPALRHRGTEPDGYWLAQVAVLL